MAKIRLRNFYTKDILKTLLLVGAFTVAATSPYFCLAVIKAYFKHKKYNRQSFTSTFCRLRREGLISIEKRNKQIYISLTEEGKKKAEKYQINDLKLERPKKWDKKWRVVVFDISHSERIKREALRGKLKELGFYQLQKSVWLTPFECHQEIKLLRDFFGLSEDDLRIIIAEKIGDDKEIKRYFNL